MIRIQRIRYSLERICYSLERRGKGDPLLVDANKQYNGRPGVEKEIRHGEGMWGSDYATQEQRPRKRVCYRKQYNSVQITGGNPKRIENVCQSDVFQSDCTSRTIGKRQIGQ